MRQETPRRPRAIKRDPEHSSSLATARPSHTVAHSTADTNVSQATSARTPINQSPHRLGRSDAREFTYPTPVSPSDSVQCSRSS